MSNPPITGLSSVPPRLSQDSVDTLLREVGRQVASQTFDSSQDSVFDDLIECLGDVRGMTRLRAATLLGEEIGTPATPFLTVALRDHPNVVVRRAAAKTLALIENPEAVPALLEALFQDDDTVVKGSVVGALARTGEVAAPELLSILRSPDNSESLKGHAAWALAFMGDAAENHLYEALSSDSPDVRAAVIGALAKLLQETPTSRGFVALVQALDDTDEEIQCEAMTALGNLGHQPATPRLITLLESERSQIRKSAALALMKMGLPEAIAPLKT
ncbi:MAG: HEAT repeat domain-containing protein, partial [Leptolyngbyaceae cyanobacterium]